MTVKYQYIDGSSHKCRPDIVILDDIADPTNPPDLNGGNWPILWACEIKYQNEGSDDWDIEKLRYLITQGVVQYGCWIKMLRLLAPQGNGVIWSSDATIDRIRIYDVRLPAPNTIK